MGKGSPFKILVAMVLGFALAAVGMDTVTGQLRLTFGSTELMRGFDFLIAVIGLFGIGEILLSMEEGLEFSGKSAQASTRRSCWQTWKELPKLLGRPRCAARWSASGWASRRAARRRPRS